MALTRHRWLLATACVVIVLAAVVFARRASERQQRLNEQLAEWRELQELEKQLDQVIELKFDTPVTLQTWLDELQRQSGVTVVVHGEAAKLSMPLGFSFDPRRKPARAFLDRLARHADCYWRPDESGAIGFYPYESLRPPLVVRSYPLDLSFSPRLQVGITDALKAAIEPDSWGDVGGYGELIASPGQLLIAQRYEMHAEIGIFLSRLQAHLRTAAELPAAGLLADDPRLQSVPLTERTDHFQETHAALAQRVSFDFVDVPLQDCLEQLGKEAGVLIVTGVRLEGVVPGDLPVTLKGDNLRLATALRLLLNPFDADISTGSDGTYLRVVTFADEYSPDNMRWRAYPIPDFASAVGSADDPLAELVSDTVDPLSWQDVGGPGTVRRLGNLLLVAQSPQNQVEVAELLHALRTVRSGAEPWANIRVASPDREETARQLQRPLALRYEAVTLRDFVADIAERGGVRVVLTGWLEDLKLTPESIISCDLSERPLAENLYAALAPYELSYELQEDCVAITPEHRVNWPEHMAGEIIDARSCARQIAIPQLCSLVRAAVEPDSWSEYGGPGTIEEFAGLLVVQHRPEVRRQVRHVLAVVQNQLQQPQAQVPAQLGNLLTRVLFDQHPKDLQPRLYAVDDLLAPRGSFSPSELIEALQVSEIRRFENRNLRDIPHFEVHAGRFLVAYLHNDHIAPLEAKLRELRRK